MPASLTRAVAAVLHHMRVANSQPVCAALTRPGHGAGRPPAEGGSNCRQQAARHSACCRRSWCCTRRRCSGGSRGRHGVSGSGGSAGAAWCRWAVACCCSITRCWRGHGAAAHAQGHRHDAVSAGPGAWVCAHDAGLVCVGRASSSGCHRRARARAAASGRARQHGGHAGDGAGAQDAGAAGGRCGVWLAPGNSSRPGVAGVVLHSAAKLSACQRALLGTL
jgi:hypothetical protein